MYFNSPELQKIRYKLLGKNVSRIHHIYEKYKKKVEILDTCPIQALLPQNISCIFLLFFIPGNSENASTAINLSLVPMLGVTLWRERFPLNSRSVPGLRSIWFIRVWEEPSLMIAGSWLFMYSFSSGYKWDRDTNGKFYSTFCLLYVFFKSI